MYTRSGRSLEERRVLSDPSRLVNNASSFRKLDVDSLNIVFAGTETFHDIFGTTALSIPQMFSLNSVSPSGPEKTLRMHVERVAVNSEVAKGTDESRTDSMVAYMLRKLDLDEDPYFLEIKPWLRFKVHTHCISARPEFTVQKNGSYMFVDEDKHIKNVDRPSAWGEHQLAAEIIALAYTNFNDPVFNKDYQTIYCMRVIGTKFTFYRADVTTKYLLSLGDGFPEERLHILRYPSNNGPFSTFDYMDVSERKQITNILGHMKGAFNVI